jgi:hypothetical protein
MVGNGELEDKGFVRLWFKGASDRDPIKEFRGGLLELGECEGFFGGSWENTVAGPKGSINKSDSPR